MAQVQESVEASQNGESKHLKYNCDCTLFHCTTLESFLQDHLLDAFLWRISALLLTEKKLRYRVVKRTGMSS